MTCGERLCLVGLLLGMLLLGLPAPPIGAETFNSGSTGADGAFNPPGSVPAGTTVNGSTYTVPLPATGIYNFTTINVASGLTVTFARNAANTPVFLLATGNITITGTIDVSGSVAPSGGFQPGRGGPGGFDGGIGADGLTTNLGGAGLGPGGGGGGTANGLGGAPGGYGTAGQAGYYLYCASGAGPAYGSSLLRPILGGSGGGGASGSLGVGYGGGGGGGGGAVQIASSTQITLTGTIRANGGNGGGGSGQSYQGGPGSGGAIRLTAPTITITNGFLYAQGGSSCGSGGAGRIRLEGSTVTYSGQVNPMPSVSLPQPVFPGTGMPALAISTIGGITVPPNPAGSALQPPDVLLPVGTANPVPVLLTASNVSVGATVQVVAIPQNGAPTTATCSLAGTLASTTCTANLNISLPQTNVVTASATFPLLASAGEGPLYVEGEEVTHVKVAAVLGGPSTATYLTRSGREVAAP